MERKIGEIFQDGDVMLKVIESTSCEGCYFNPINCSRIKPDYCSADYREDEREIHFELISNL